MRRQAEVEEVPAVLEKREPAFGHWTSVAEAMPARAKRVIVCIRGRDVRTATYRGGHGDYWMTDSNHYYRNGDDITFWMPAPPPPV